ncbi:MAG: tyrosine-type recombinase/integrase [Burkholderiales bacterium]|nr:tyrosine-type recombinase/integrase [Burkholderiales bacterium]
MGRKPTKNLNLPQGMRRRVRGDKVYYMLDTGGKPRKEIPLGTDYFLALAKYAELSVSNVTVAKFEDVITKYVGSELLKLSKNTQKIFKYDIKHVSNFFGTAPLDQIRPVHVRKFLDGMSDTPTTANRCKRLFSNLFNHARAWGYTDAENPCAGVMGHRIGKRTTYISDDLYSLVYKYASIPLKDAMDLAYLTGQRPADLAAMTVYDIIEGHLIITQEKTKQPLRIVIAGRLKETIDRIHARKDTYKVATGALLVNLQGRKMTQIVMRNYFDEARRLAKEDNPKQANAIENFRFYDLRAKAADDTADQRGHQAAADLLGHDDTRTTSKHYLRRGKTTLPTK